MNLGFRNIFAIITALSTAIITPAQELPLLPDDPSVLKGVMPNGMSYYIVSNPTSKGTADFALVQKTGKLTMGDSTEAMAESIAAGALSSLLRISTESFLSNNGILPGREGFVRLADDATVFRFSDVMVRDNVVDSTLLLIMDIADRANYVENDAIRKWYAPSDQAVIVSGDVDSKTVAAKLCNMSYMIRAGESAPRPEYIRREETMSGIVRKKSAHPGLVEISETWTSLRAPREYMNTVQPEMFEMSLNILGRIAVHEIRKGLRDSGIPAADVSYGHVCSGSHPYDDTFTVMATVNSADSDRASAVFSEVMDSIASGGAGYREYSVAEADYLSELEDLAVRAIRPDGEYVDRCIYSFLYNTSLASERERLSFHKSRQLPDSMRLKLFNDIASALLGGNGSAGRKTDAAAAEPVSYIPQVIRDKKFRLKSSKKEPVSGGTIWTFSNGFRVIFRKMPSDRIYYGLTLNGGYGNIEGIEAGEGAFMADYFKTCKIGGLEAGEFIDRLKVRGMSMDVIVNVSNMIISGYVPEDSVELLLQSLLVVANERTADNESFEYYRESEYMALDAAEDGFVARMTAIDSIMCPDYRYSPYKVRGRMTDDFCKSAERYYEDRFSKMNDGSLILVGNIDETKLKRLLLLYGGDFRTSGGAFRRPVIRYQPVSGWSTYMVDGNKDNIDVAISARMPLTMDNWLAADLAASILDRKLARELNGDGVYADLTHNCRIYPEERVNMLISVSGTDGPGVCGKTSVEVLSDVRAVLSALPRITITDEELKPYKEALKHRIREMMKEPSYWIHAIALRYLDGKDLSTNYAAKVDALTPEKVMSVLSLLDSGSKVEYVTNKKQSHVSRNYNSD